MFKGDKILIGISIILIFSFGIGTLNAADVSTTPNNIQGVIHYNNGTDYCPNLSIHYITIPDYPNFPISNYIPNVPPEFMVDFSSDVRSGNSPLTVHFTDKSMNKPTSWFWNFGDGTNSTLQNPTHTYIITPTNLFGLFWVNLTTSNGTVTLHSMSQPIDVINSKYTPPTFMFYPYTTPLTVSANIKSGFYNTNKIVKLNMSDSGTIYYTLNGKTPTTKSHVYLKPITINSTTTLKYFAVNILGNPSSLHINTYKIDKIKPAVVSSTPRNNDNTVQLTTPITIKFSENIFKSTQYSKIYLKNINTNQIVSINKSVTGNKLTIKMVKSRLSSNKYQLYIPQEAVKDHAGNNNNKKVLNFKTK